MALTLLLLRHAVHGHPPDMLCGRMEGVPLAAEGWRQAGRLARRFPAGSLDMLSTSPMQRCRETATAFDARALVEPEADEVDFGAWTGARLGALAAEAEWRRWNEQRDAAAAPGGESMAQVRARVLALLDRMMARHPGGRVALVTHAEIIRTVVLHVLGLPLQAYGRLEIGPASITTLELWPGGGRLLGLNDVSHLAALEPAKEAEPA